MVSWWAGLRISCCCGRRDYGNQLLITLATVTIGYGVALEIDVSGPIAMVVAGLVGGNLTAPRLVAEVRKPLQTFWSGIDDILNSLLFVMIGLVAVTIHSLPLAPLGSSVLVAVVVCLVARAISVYLPLVALNATPSLNANTLAMTKLFTWGGLRGGLALALALSLPDSPAKPLIINMTFGVVAVSILIQGVHHRQAVLTGFSQRNIAIRRFLLTPLPEIPQFFERDQDMEISLCWIGNEPCPCGSGRKYKHCHGGNVRRASVQGNPDQLLRRARELARQGRLDESIRLFEELPSLPPVTWTIIPMFYCNADLTPTCEKPTRF